MKPAIMVTGGGSGGVGGYFGARLAAAVARMAREVGIPTRFSRSCRFIYKV